MSTILTIPAAICPTPTYSVHNEQLPVIKHLHNGKMEPKSRYQRTATADHPSQTYEHKYPVRLTVRLLPYLAGTESKIYLHKSLSEELNEQSMVFPQAVFVRGLSWITLLTSSGNRTWPFWKRFKAISSTLPHTACPAIKSLPHYVRSSREWRPWDGLSNQRATVCSSNAGGCNETRKNSYGATKVRRESCQSIWSSITKHAGYHNSIKSLCWRFGVRETRLCIYIRLHWRYASSTIETPALKNKALGQLHENSTMNRPRLQISCRMAPPPGNHQSQSSFINKNTALW